MSKMSSGVQQSPADEARRCRLLRHRTRTHKFRRHRVHAMLWDGRREGLAASREWPLTLPRRMVPKMHGCRAPSPCSASKPLQLALSTETDAHADSDWFIRFASDLRLCTLRCGGRARVQSHHWRCDVRGLQRCTRTDLSGSDTILQILPTLVWNYSTIT